MRHVLLISGNTVEERLSVYDDSNVISGTFKFILRWSRMSPETIALGKLLYGRSLVLYSAKNFSIIPLWTNDNLTIIVLDPRTPNLIIFPITRI